MKLLICTQKVGVNDPVLGFFHRWIEEFAKHCESVVVICLEKGEYDLPRNVRVLSLGKPAKGWSPPKADAPREHASGGGKLLYCWRFYKYLLRERENYDTVFIHMNPEYAVLAGWIWKIMGKKINLWYVHRQVNLKLRIAAFWADKIFSVSPESFCLRSKKVEFVGHGIDTEFFRCNAKKEKTGGFKIISVGRITKIKNLDVLIESVGMLSADVRKQISVEIIGGPVTEGDKKYLQELKNSVKIKQLSGVVKFIGPVPYGEMVNLYCQSDLLVNLCPRGGIDKVVLEAMSCCVPVLLSNESFSAHLGYFKDQLMFKQGDIVDLAHKIQNLLMFGMVDMGRVLREQVVVHHNLGSLVNNMILTIDQNNKR